MDRPEVADFLRRRREALQPEDAGLPRGPRRRTSGLRREEVAALVGMSADYYARMERGRSPQPSEQMVAAIARGLRLSLDERDHLFLLAGYKAPQRDLRSDHVDVGLMRVLDRLSDTPAEIITGLGETLIQTRLAAALLGNETGYTGMARSAIYRWFTDPSSRLIYPEEDHERHSRVFASRMRSAVTGGGTRSRAAGLVEDLRKQSVEFGRLWNEHEIGVRHSEEKRIVHPELGLMTLYCQQLLDIDQSQTLLVFTATPGSESYDKLQLLGVIGEQRLQL